MQRTILKLIDARPTRRSNWRKATVLWIEGDPAAERAAVSASLVNAFLRELPIRDQIASLYVHRSSALTEVPDLSLLPKLEEVSLAGPHLESYETLRRVTALDTLVVFGYGHPDFSFLAHLHPQWLQLGRAAPEVFDLSCQLALLQSWPRLRRFGPCSVERLILQACNNVSLETLANLQQLKRLDLIGCRKLDSLAFVAACSTLETLVLTQAPHGKLDFTPVLESSSLRKLFLSAGGKFLRSLADRNPKLVITNGDVCFHDNASVDPQVAFYGHAAQEGHPP